MLKYVLGLLLLLNAAVLAWQWDAFAPWGSGPNQQREPERLQQQIQPEALTFERPGQPDSAAPVAVPPDLAASVPLEPASAAEPASSVPR